MSCIIWCWPICTGRWVGRPRSSGASGPTDRYIVGRLAPDGTVIEPDTQDESADTDGADLGEDHA